jgi:hypothetical protein
VATKQTELNELKRIGAKAHKNSGRGMVKGDGSMDHYVVDVKEYENSFSVSRDVWAKICMDTIKVDNSKEPVLCIVLGKHAKTRLAIISWDEFEELREYRAMYEGLE